MGRWLLALLIAVVSAVVTAAIVAPAGVADWMLARSTQGRLRLVDATGTVWNGQARLLMAEVVSSAEDAPERALDGVMLPGRVSWTLSALPLVIGMIDGTLKVEGMAQPIRLNGTFNELQLGNAALDLPRIDLARLGSPWNTLRPSAILGLRWEGLTVRRGTFEGKLFVDLRDVGSAMTPVRPLGSYRIEVNGQGRRADLAIRTLVGPLLLTGNGTWDTSGGLRFTAEASAEQNEQARLQSFLALLGRREADKTIIKLGA